MSTRGVEFVAYYIAWDTAANGFKTGDVANHTVYWTKDGTATVCTNSPSEVDATNKPGHYKVTITSTETDCLSGDIGGKSSTANIVLIPTHYAFHNSAVNSL